MNVFVKIGIVADILKKRRTASFDLNSPFLTLITTVAVNRYQVECLHWHLSHAIANESNCNPSFAACHVPLLSVEFHVVDKLPMHMVIVSRTVGS